MSTKSTPKNPLFKWYERYIGDPETEDVYLGFALFFGGIALGGVGILIFLLSGVVTADPAFVYALREIGFAAAAAGLPVALLGIVVLLPGDTRMTYAAVAGLVVCGAAVALFVATYPEQWNVGGGAGDYSAEGVAVYAVGLVAVVGSTAAALVGHQVERAAGGPVATEADADAQETVTDEDVERDIEEAMSNVELSWGGVEKRDGKRLQLNTEVVDEVDRTGFENATAKTARANGGEVDDAVAGLRQLRGEGNETASGSGTDDQTNALRELREQKRAEEAAKPDGWLARLKALLSR
ncbi:MAG: DUF7139 domain-containing protein [Halobacteriota archaeon]